MKILAWRETHSVCLQYHSPASPLPLQKKVGQKLKVESSCWLTLVMWGLPSHKKIKKLSAVSLKNFHKNENLGYVRPTLSDYSINQLLKKRTKLCFQSQTDFCKFAQQCADNLPSLRLIQHPTYVISGIYNIAHTCNISHTFPTSHTYVISGIFKRQRWPLVPVLFVYCKFRDKTA